MTRNITLAEFVWLAEQVTSLEASVITNASRIDLADSALHAPAAGFGDEAETAMLAVAAREVDEAWFASWLRDRVRFAEPR